MRTFTLLIIGIIVGAILYRFWQDYWAKQQKAQELAAQKPVDTPQTAERMVKCQYCGIYVPESEAFEEDHYFFCSDAHRLAARNRDSA